MLSYEVVVVVVVQEEEKKGKNLSPVLPANHSSSSYSLSLSLKGILTNYYIIGPGPFSSSIVSVGSLSLSIVLCEQTRMLFKLQARLILALCCFWWCFYHHEQVPRKS